MTYQPTQVNVVRIDRVGDVTTTELRLAEGSWPGAPLAPATLWEGEQGVRSRVMDLHHLVSADDESAVFESYEAPEVGLARTGPYSLISWFRPDQFAAVQDTSLEWAEKPYDGKDDDETCLLTWKTIMPGDLAYVSDAGWISVEAYDEFIRDDRLRLRA